MKHILFTAYLLISTLFLNAVEVVNQDVYSNAMKKNIKTSVVIPNNYKKTGKPFPVIYLLHGYGGNYASWVNDFPQVIQFADQYSMIVVGVEGGTSWYFDSPIDSSMRYETYVTKELISFIDSNYNTVKDRKGRAISGLSMGGHGALYLAMRHLDIFGASGSMSGGVDIRPFPVNWNLPNCLGDRSIYPENWEKNTVINQLHHIKYDQLAIIIDCGISDFFIEVNRNLHEKMLYLNIVHDYIERPGGHKWEYWNNSLQYQFLFFNDFFKKMEN